MTFRDYVLRERRVEVDYDVASAVTRVRISRRNGTWRAVAATDLVLQESRESPVEIFRRMVRDDPLDAAAISLLAAPKLVRRDLDVTFDVMREALIRVRNASRRVARDFGRIQPVVDRPEPLAPPGDRVPFYRPR
jgi:hypothetical protein